jgi:hypothetical protein
VNPDDIAHLRATIQERLDAAERVAVDHSQANRTRYDGLYALRVGIRNARLEIRARRHSSGGDGMEQHGELGI